MNDCIILLLSLNDSSRPTSPSRKIFAQGNALEDVPKTANTPQHRKDSSEGGTQQMRRIARSPARTDTNTYTHSYSDDSYEDSDSIDEIEATLTNVDDQLDDTEQALSTWSSSSSNPRQPTVSTGYGYTGSGTYSSSYTGSASGSYTATPGSYTGSASGSYTATPGSYTGSPSFVSLPSVFSPTSPTSGTNTQSSYPPPANDPRARLSRITERTEGTSSRPVSGTSQATTVPARPRSAFLPTTPGRGGHARSSTDYDKDLPPPGRANELIGMFEATSHSRSSSPTKTSSSYTHSQTPTSGFSLLSPPDRPSTVTGSSYTPTYTGSTSFGQSTLSPSQFTTTQQTTTQTATGTGDRSPERHTSTLRRPGQSSPRSPLASVRNIVALWKERSPTKPGQSKPASVSSGSVSPTPETRQRPLPPSEDPEGLFGLRRRASGRMSGRSLPEAENAGQRASTGSVGTEASELGRFLGVNAGETPLHLGTLYYLNVHGQPPYQWQRCQALLYHHTLLISWLAPTSSAERAPMGRAVVQLDLVNCLTVESALSLGHPRARDDVGAIAAREQDARTRATREEKGS
ncbi:hypothetical protein D9758_014100 [Tetrapyrgos nigripes]|uniref:Uncharacterized protein n=1 Tax=Tetrapyrgos nigripes TaxID=182062 RepID=A0A8H5CC54_9AGAR|nr:hypothetical protein D9758_014100 [Tetrapyrgos nigripes]